MTASDPAALLREALGVGAPPSPRPGTGGPELLVLALDTLCDGVHFPRGTAPADIGYKAVAVNLSDLAAMGAAPDGVSVAVVAPGPAPEWIRALAAGVREALAPHRAPVLAASLAAGPVAITVEAQGRVAPDRVLRRAGARPGDQVAVTGTLGDAGLALAALEGRVRISDTAARHCRSRLDRPRPRVAAGRVLGGLASAAVDVSDGLARDLGHVLAASGVGATLDLARLPLSPAMRASVPLEEAWRLALGSGDDYELCFTAPAAAMERLAAMRERLECPLSVIGRVDAEPGLRVRHPAGALRPAGAGFDHFA